MARAIPVCGFRSTTAAIEAMLHRGMIEDEILGLINRDRAKPLSRKMFCRIVWDLKRAARVDVGVRVRREVQVEMQRHAKARGMHTRTLMARVLEIVAFEIGVDSVMDDGVAVPPAETDPEAGR